MHENDINRLKLPTARSRRKVRKAVPRENILRARFSREWGNGFGDFELCFCHQKAKKQTSKLLDARPEEQWLEIIHRALPSIARPTIALIDQQKNLTYKTQKLKLNQLN